MRLPNRKVLYWTKPGVLNNSLLELKFFLKLYLQLQTKKKVVCLFLKIFGFLKTYLLNRVVAHLQILSTLYFKNPWSLPISTRPYKLGTSSMKNSVSETCHFTKFVKSHTRVLFILIFLSMKITNSESIRNWLVEISSKGK